MKKLQNKIIGLIIAIVVLAIPVLFNSENEPVSTIPYVANSELEIIFFDVGQADSTLIISGNKTMLIDGGEDESGAFLVKQIQDLGINKIDYLIATHMHADHIGGLDKIVKELEIGDIYMPDTEHPTKQVQEFLQAIDEKNLQYELVEIGKEIMLEEAKCEVMYVDNNLPANLNLASIVIQLEFGNQKFLFMADAEKAIEQARQWEKVDVLKVGHHGSNTSSTEEFLNQVHPSISVISVGKNNSYKHPTQEVLNRLLAIETKIYRTDEMGSIWITSNGNESTVKTLDERK